MTLAAFLTQEENRKINAIKEYIIDHANPKAEIDFYGSRIKMYPLFNLGLDFINTLFVKQDIINKIFPQSFIKRPGRFFKESPRRAEELTYKQNL